MSFLREKLEKKFADEYAKLNDEQRIAVDAIEGPVMVIAGPGTGKTQILASLCVLCSINPFALSKMG